MNTHTHILSSTATAFTTGGVEAYDIGPTNFVISFSGANATANYLKFLVKYDDDDTIYTVATPTDNIDNVRTQSVSRTFYPGPDWITSYTIDVSGVKNTLAIDRYRINLKLGHEVATKYNDMRIVNSTLYTNDDGADFLLVTIEGENPRYTGNVVIPFWKDPKYYLPPPPIVFKPNDNRILRLEMFTQSNAHGGVVFERSNLEIISEEQYEIWAIGTEGSSDLTNTAGDIYDGARIIELDKSSYYYPRNFTHSRQGYWLNEPGMTAGSVASGDDIEDYFLHIPESGIDYSIYNTPDFGGLFENDGIINVTITDIYVDGIAP